MENQSTTYTINKSNYIMMLHNDYHRGIGKTTFICRLLMHYVVEDVLDVVVWCRTMEDVKTFKDKFVIPALIAEKNLRYMVKSDKEILVSGPYTINPSICLRRPDTSINFEILNGHPNNIYPINTFYNFNKYRSIQHDSNMVDMCMVNELKILREPDERLPLYINHKWTWDLLHKDYIERLKKIKCFAA